MASAINRFETYTKHHDFKAFHFELAVAFKKHAAAQEAQRTGENLSKDALTKMPANFGYAQNMLSK